MFFVLAIFLATAPLQAAPSPDATVLQYERMLRESEAHHRAYIQSLLGGAAALIAVFTGYLTWLNWKTRKEMIADIRAEYRAAAEKAAQQLEAETFQDFQALQKRIRELDLTVARHKVSAESPPPRAEAAAPSPRILWVDDHPANNEQEEQLIVGRWQATIERALSTEEAMRKLAQADYDLVIEDMKRQKNERAGIDLLRRLDGEVPVIVYCSSKLVQRYGKEATACGAAAATDSPAALMEAVQRILEPAA